MSGVMDTLPAHTLLTQDFATTAENLRRSTVHVRNGRAGSGSGVIWRSDGLIVTNAHVARGPHAAVELWDGREFDGEVIDHNPQRDLAAIRIAATDLSAVTVGDSDALRVGQIVAAVGNPLGLSGAMSTGIIHAIAPARERGGGTWVQADVHLAPGNSGGPLADVLGCVIGINSMVYGGLGLAVPSNDVITFLQGQAPRPRLGIATQPIVLGAGDRRVLGLLVLETEANSPADRAGLIIGDVLTGASGHAFTAPGDLGAVLQQAGVAGVLSLDISRGGQSMVVNVTLATEDGTQREAA